MPSRRDRELARKKPTFQYSPFSPVLAQIAEVTANDVTSPKDHCEATRRLEELRRDFLDNSMAFLQITEVALEEATTWPIPAPFKKHLHAIFDDHTTNIKPIEAALPRLMYNITQLPIEYKQELQATADWQRATGALAKANEMVFKLNFPAILKKMLAESQPDYELALQVLGEWKESRMDLLNRHWVTVVRSVEKLSTTSDLEVSERVAMVLQAQYDYDMDFEPSDNEFEVLKGWGRGRLGPELDDEQTHMVVLKSLKTKIEDYFFALSRVFLKEPLDDDPQEGWTLSRLDVVRKILKAPKTIEMSVDPPSDDKAAQQVHEQLREDRDAIYYLPFEEPTCLSCNHVFSFDDIVPVVDDYRNCPMCRQPACLDDLQRLVVVRTKDEPDCKGGAHEEGADEGEDQGDDHQKVKDGEGGDKEGEDEEYKSEESKHRKGEDD